MAGVVVAGRRLKSARRGYVLDARRDAFSASVNRRASAPGDADGVAAATVGHAKAPTATAAVWRSVRRPARCAPEAEGVIRWGMPTLRRIRYRCCASGYRPTVAVEAH